MPERVFSEGLMLPDGRKVRVLSYDDGSLRFRVSEPPYVLEEAYLSGGRSDHAIVKLAPRNSIAPAAPSEAGLRESIENLVEMLESADEPEGDGRIVIRHQRAGALSALKALLLLSGDDDEAAESEPNDMVGGEIDTDAVHDAIASLPEVFHTWDVIDLVEPPTTPPAFGHWMSRNSDELGIEKTGTRDDERGQEWRRLP